VYGELMYIDEEQLSKRAIVDIVLSLATFHSGRVQILATGTSAENKVMTGQAGSGSEKAHLETSTLVTAIRIRFTCQTTPLISIKCRRRVRQKKGSTLDAGSHMFHVICSL
jgi:hypothetical protein